MVSRHTYNSIFYKHGATVMSKKLLIYDTNVPLFAFKY